MPSRVSDRDKGYEDAINDCRRVLRAIFSGLFLLLLFPLPLFLAVFIGYGCQGMCSKLIFEFGSSCIVVRWIVFFFFTRGRVRDIGILLSLLILLRFFFFSFLFSF